MTILIVCLFVAVLLPYFVKLPLAIAMNQIGGYDNSQPREQQAKLKGFGARALGAHQNCFEGLIIFSTVVLTALVTHKDTALIQFLAVSYIVSRLVYVYLYLMDKSTLRSIFWFVGFLICLSILLLCLV